MENRGRLKMIQIAIIGSGQIGSRHLQGVALLKRECAVHLVGSTAAAISMAQKRYAEVISKRSPQKLHTYTGINRLSTDIDVAIMAGTADVRKDVLQTLLKRCHVKNIIFEKVLFQKMNDYDEAKRLIKKHKIHAWVNCARRMWPGYRKLRGCFPADSILRLSVTGSRWGLGCNAIHMIDMLSFLGGGIEYQVFTDRLDKKILRAKRKGFVEFTGEFHGRFKGGAAFNLVSHYGGALPLLVSIESENTRCLIAEEQGHCWIATARKKWKWEKIPFSAPLQSRLSNVVIDSIVERGDCGLTPFVESVQLHLPMIRGFSEFLRPRRPADGDWNCPIT